MSVNSFGMKKEIEENKTTKTVSGTSVSSVSDKL